MTPARFLAAALALASALPTPVASLPDRYRAGRQHPPEATDPREEDDRPKRAYATWTDYESFSRWKPAPYRLTRPYFIPVYGAAGKTPIYFPPQKLNLNPGVPIDNPLPNRPFRGPGYLPPTTEKPTTMSIINRFNGGEEDDDERPVWGGSNDEREMNVIPTRVPKVSGTTDFPPLMHDINRGTNALAAESEVEESAPVSRTTAPPLGPSNCAWAIVSCCSVSSTNVPDSCFEQRGCPGPFWGMSPCDSEFAKSAIASALNYYQSS